MKPLNHLIFIVSARPIGAKKDFEYSLRQEKPSAPPFRVGSNGEHLCEIWLRCTNRDTLCCNAKYVLYLSRDSLDRLDAGMLDVSQYYLDSASHLVRHSSYCVDMNMVRLYAGRPLTTSVSDMIRFGPRFANAVKAVVANSKRNLGPLTGKALDDLLSVPSSFSLNT